MDTGGTLAGGVAAEHDELIVRAMSAMAYDALNAGQAEQQAGPTAISRLADPAAPVALRSETKSPAGSGASGDVLKTQPYLIREVAGVRVALVGIASPPDSAREPGVWDPEADLRPLLADLRNKADVIVALADVEPREVRALGLSGLGFQVVLGSRSVELTDAKREGQTIVASAGPDGQYVGKLTLMVDARGQVVSFENEATPLESSIAEDPAVAELRGQYK